MNKKGCTVIGFVGSEEKLDWCKNELGFDHVFNYKKIGISEALKQVAPDGVDIYFDNVNDSFHLYSYIFTCIQYNVFV